MPRVNWLRIDYKNLDSETLDALIKVITEDFERIIKKLGLEEVVREMVYSYGVDEVAYLVAVLEAKITEGKGARDN